MRFILKRYPLITFLIIFPISIVSADYSIFLKEKARLILQQCSRNSPAYEGSWNPTKKEIAEMESNFFKLKDLEATGCCGEGKIQGNPIDYYRQYAGIIIKNQKYIYINALSDYPSWNKKEPQMVCDGGKNYWGVLYNLKNKSFSNLAFNGEA